MIVVVVVVLQVGSFLFSFSLSFSLVLGMEHQEIRNFWCCKDRRWLWGEEVHPRKRSFHFVKSLSHYTQALVVPGGKACSL